MVRKGEELRNPRKVKPTSTPLPSVPWLQMNTFKPQTKHKPIKPFVEILKQEKAMNIIIQRQLLNKNEQGKLR